MEKKLLNNDELISISGGCPSCQVSNDQHVQLGYSFGYHLGEAIGETISEVGAIIKAISPFSWFK